MQKIISFSPPDITQQEIDEVVDTLKSGWITTGPKTKEFEKNIATYCNTKKAVCLNSATAAMELVLHFLGIGEGDEVITSAYTYTASASVIHHVGAKIILVDTEKDSFFMDKISLENAITERTKAIIPVDIAGVMCDYDSLFEIVNKKKHLFNPKNDIQKAIGRVVVLADAAHSMGAMYKGLISGSVADFTSFSFHAIKNLTTAEGGALTWKPIKGFDDEWIYTQFMLLSLHGQSKDALTKNTLGSWEYDILAPNYKCNMTDIMASLGLIQLKRYPTILARRKEIIQLYDTMLESLPLVTLQHYNKLSSSSGHLYLIRLIGFDEKRRNNVIEQMKLKGVATNVHYKPLPLLTAYKNLGFDIKNYPHAFNQYENEISLPLHTLLSNDDVAYIVSVLKEVIYLQ